MFLKLINQKRDNYEKFEILKFKGTKVIFLSLIFVSRGFVRLQPMFFKLINRKRDKENLKIVEFKRTKSKFLSLIFSFADCAD